MQMVEAGIGQLVTTWVERPKPIVHGNIELRPAEFQVLVEGRRTNFTVREFEVLLALTLQLDRVLTREQIYEQVWGGKMKRRDRAVDVFIRKIRLKLERAAPGWCYIHTHFGVGYRFAPERIASS